MALQTSGAISLSDIQTEFGGANPIGLNEYYAGGSYVPTGTTGTNGAVPSSGTISLWNFYGTLADFLYGMYYAGYSSDFLNTVTRINSSGALVGSETTAGTARSGLAGAGV